MRKKLASYIWIRKSGLRLADPDTNEIFTDHNTYENLLSYTAENCGKFSVADPHQFDAHPDPTPLDTDPTTLFFPYASNASK